VADLTALLRPLYDARNPAEGVPALLAISDPGIEFRPAGLWLDNDAVRHGHEEVADFFRELEDAFGEFHFEAQRFEERDHAVAVDVRFVVRGRHSGITDSRTMGHLWRFREGRAVEIRVFRSPEEAFAAL
jgi:ketosteroid isomerase-like protein